MIFAAQITGNLKKTFQPGWLQYGFLVFLVLALIGCGKKGLPLPPPEEVPPPVLDLAAERAGEILTLTWTLPQGDNADRLAGYKVYRSTAPVEGADCPDCPVQFQLVEDVPIMASNTFGVDSEKMLYRQVLVPVDIVRPEQEAGESSGAEADRPKPAPKGVEYQYKVVGYTEDYVRSPDSNVIRASHPVRYIETPKEEQRDDS